ncbi:MAG: hypothetical protein A3K65_02000 [Euryarchaeota archaeon RBG_16_68_12]|nr:MAG: hypothetical protein A3K65_02000 [Euryarchaeota archaeon RBG_16_68_12]
MAFNGYSSDDPKQFAHWADLNIKAARDTMGLDLRYDLESLRKLDAMVDAIGKPEDLGQMVMIIGSFLGETLRRVYGGRWVWDPQWRTWAVLLPKKSGGETGPFPFAKVQKRFLNGMEDSISFFVTVTDGIVRGEIPG